MRFVYKIIFLTFIVLFYKTIINLTLLFQNRYLKSQLFSLIDSKNYQKKLKHVHEQLTTNRLDVVNYLDSISFNVNKEIVNESLLDYLNNQRLKTLSTIEKDNVFIFS